jgi:hypothetical protein
MDPEHDRPRTGPERVVSTRAPITADTVADRAGVTDDPSLAAMARDVFTIQADRSRLHARYLRLLAPLWTGRDDQDADDTAGEVEDLVAAMGLRATTGRAYGLVRDAHRAVTFFPRLLDLLAAGEITVEAFGQVLRRSQRLTGEEQSRVDEHVAAWDTGLSAETFNRALGQVCAYVHQTQDRVREAERMRQVAVRAPRDDDGIATIEISGPAPEILAYGKRLDETARAIRTAQRHALAEAPDGSDGVRVPFDDGTVAATGQAMGRGLIRYLLATQTDWDVDTIQVPAPRFRLNVTVPAMTLLGVSDAPGMLDGLHPLPADMARHLAGDSDTWYRVLTDPTSGVFLPLPADRYSPSAPMVEHLRQRNPFCAVPGCGNTTAVASEVDHIIEYDHAHPEKGGQTEIGNLHILCWRHHQLKTMGLLDPIRITDPTTSTSRGTNQKAPPARSNGATVPDDGASVPDDGTSGSPDRAGPHDQGTSASGPGTSAPTGGTSVPGHGQDAAGIPPGTTRWVFGTDPADQVTTVQADETDLIGPLEAAALHFMWDRYLHHDPQPPTTPGTRGTGPSGSGAAGTGAARTSAAGTARTGSGRPDAYGKDMDDAFRTAHEAYGTTRHAHPDNDPDTGTDTPPKNPHPGPFDPDDPPPF